MTNEPANGPGPKPATRRKKQKRGKNGRPEMLSRNVAISSFAATVRLHAVHRKGDEPYMESAPWLELRGRATESVRGVDAVRISMYPRDTTEIGTARPASVGAIIGAREELTIVFTWPQVEFDRVWALALGGSLRYAHLYFTKPHYGSGLVVSASFSSEVEE